MGVNYNEVKYILEGIDTVSDIQYKRLIEVYGRELVAKVIKDLEEDTLVDSSSNNMVNFDDRFVNSYDYYAKDLDNISEISSFEKNNLFARLIYIINELNQLFDRVGNLDNICGKKKKPLICDKVEYCLSNCTDKDLLCRMNNLYKEYVSKRNLLVEANLKFVIYIIKENFMKEYNMDFDELIQYGNIGLIRALETYNPEFGTEFTTYAGYWIKQSIIRNSRMMKYSLKIPMYLFEENNKRLSVIDKKTIELGRVPTFLEVANYMEFSLEKLKYVMDAFEPVICLDELSDMYEDDIELKNMDLVKDMDVDLEMDMIFKIMSLELIGFMNELLDNREIFILRNLYGFDNDMTQAQVAKILGVSPQRVDQIKQKAFRKLICNRNFKDMKLYLR